MEKECLQSIQRGILPLFEAFFPVARDIEKLQFEIEQMSGYIIEYIEDLGELQEPHEFEAVWRIISKEYENLQAAQKKYQEKMLFIKNFNKEHYMGV